MSTTVTFPGLGLEFEIDRVAFSIGGFNVYWYGVLIACGLLLALAFAFRHCTEFGVDGDAMVDVAFIGAVLGVICARIYYVLMSPYGFDSLWDVVNIRGGGLAIYGGIIGGLGFGALACKWRKLPVLPMYDLTCMCFLIGQGIGRWGNFVNQEAFGYNTTLPWGMYSEVTRAYLMNGAVTLPAGMTIDPNLPVHPTFLYESIWCLAGFGMLWRYMKKRRFHGDIALRYLIWYGLGRFWIEGLRTDSLLLVPSIGLRASQLVAALAVVGGIALEIYFRRRTAGKPLMVKLAVSAENRALQKKLEQKTGKPVPVEEPDAVLEATQPRAKFLEQTAEYNASLKTRLEAELAQAG